MSSVQLSYNLLPADRYANSNFRHTFFGLAIVETMLTCMSTTLCLILSICIYTGQPFILLHTSFHPFIQASIFMTAAVSQLFKLLALLFFTLRILVNDGNIFISSATNDVRPSLEREQGEKSPNQVARKCFQKRQEHVKRLRKIIKLYPLIQLLCGSLSLAFWCTSDERHQISQRYYHQLQHTQGPSNITFLLYLVTWSIDLVVTPLFLLITTWHYSRVDWQMQLLAAQQTMDHSLRRSTRAQHHPPRSSAGVKRLSRMANPSEEGNKKRKSMRAQKTRSKDRVESRPRERPGQEMQKGSWPPRSHSRDVHTRHVPVSVPVSPSTSSSSPCPTSPSLTTTNDVSFDAPQRSTQQERGTERTFERQLMRMTAPIRRSASADLHTLLRPPCHPHPHPRHISAYLNVEAGGVSTTRSSVSIDSTRPDEGSDSFRICIHTEDSSSTSSHTREVEQNTLQN